MRTLLVVSGFAALTLVAVACVVGRTDQPAQDDPQNTVAGVDGEDASLSSPLAQPAVTPPGNRAEVPVAADVPVDQNPAANGASPQDPNGGSGACPANMVLVDGEACSEPEYKCIDWMEDPIKFPFARCRAYEAPATCKGTRSHQRFCMDRLEAGDDTGIPIGDISWTNAKAGCEASGKRLCQEHEWIFACEGEEMRPYPYGFERNSTICNFEHTEGLVTLKGELADLRMPVTANPQCLSPFGIQNMVGNIDEWVVLDKPHYSQHNGNRKMMSGLKGGWWGPLRNRCRPVTVDHDEVFHELQTGYRCCADAK